ncbi:MAG: M23 family metallopeptidase [Bacillota bacterium]|nr:M23 family metallopeptidase [Bacillota bacterium]
MKKNENHTARRVQTAAICCCLCLLAVGAGVTYRAFDHGQELPMEEAAEMPVSSMKKPTIEVAPLDQNRQSNDPGEAPEEEKPKTEKKTAAQPVFAYPLTGEVLLPFSAEHGIYDPTLKQYRTNASISLSAKQGAAVGAAADGTVREIQKDEEAGTRIILSHGGGWQTSYGQMEDTLQVKVGDSVVQGQTLGTVAMPTKYGAALGSHLEFAMAQNGEPKDPVKHLKKAE